jgi:hypothetical protein
MGLEPEAPSMEKFMNPKKPLGIFPSTKNKQREFPGIR